MRPFEVNIIGTARLTLALLDNIALGSNNRLITVLSNQTAPGQRKSYGQTAACTNNYFLSSKAAPNHFMRQIAIELASRRIGILLIDPGTACRGATFTETVSSRKNVVEMSKLVDCFTLEKSGRLFSHDGVELPI